MQDLGNKKLWPFENNSLHFLLITGSDCRVIPRGSGFPEGRLPKWEACCPKPFIHQAIFQNSNSSKPIIPDTPANFGGTRKAAVGTVLSRQSRRINSTLLGKEGVNTRTKMEQIVNGKIIHGFSVLILLGRESSLIKYGAG